MLTVRAVALLRPRTCTSRYKQPPCYASRTRPPRGKSSRFLLSFIFCMSMGNAFQLPRGLVPRQGEPGGARVGGKPAGGSKAGQSIELSEALRRGKRGTGIAGTRHLDAGSLEPWATPPGAQNKHNGQSLAEPGGLAQGDGVMVLPRADRPRAPAPPHVWLQGPRGWVQVPCEGARQLRCAVVRLWGCGDDDFWMLCEGRALADDMKVPQSGSHVQVRLRGVGGMHPGFATPNEIEEALREEAERKGTAQVPERAVLSASADTCRYSIPLLTQTCLLTSSGSTRNGSCSEATETTDDRDLKIRQGAPSLRPMHTLNPASDEQASTAKTESSANHPAKPCARQERPPRHSAERRSVMARAARLLWTSRVSPPSSAAVRPPNPFTFPSLRGAQRLCTELPGMARQGQGWVRDPHARHSTMLHSMQEGALSPNSAEGLMKHGRASREAT